MSSPEGQQMLLHYRLGPKIGSGGMGEVYKAEDTKLGRTVAIKLLPTDTHHDANARRRFFREARPHPSIKAGTRERARFFAGQYLSQ